jgi:hypothetical protein
MPDAGGDFRSPVAMHGGRRARCGTSVGQHGVARRRIEKVFEEKQVEQESDPLEIRCVRDRVSPVM